MTIPRRRRSRALPEPDARTDWYNKFLAEELTIQQADALATYRCTRCMMGLGCPGRDRWERIAASLRKAQT